MIHVGRAKCEDCKINIQVTRKRSGSVPDMVCPICKQPLTYKWTRMCELREWLK